SPILLNKLNQALDKGKKILLIKQDTSTPTAK
ncbi:MAG: hypothetical protein UX17_C0067G0001, partial [Parcubacteria group bacterium GW2011_GWC2_45_7]